MMSVEEYLKSIGINEEPVKSDNDSYVINIINSNQYGRIFSKLERSNDLDPLEDNQVVTEEGSSLVYESESEPFLLSLLADFAGDTYQLVINKLEV